MENHSIGKTIAALRTDKGWTQLELANKLSVTDKTISKWENEGGTPNIEIYPKLAELFGVTIDYLMTGREPEISLDNMDSEKRAALIIERDDADSFDKYGYNTERLFIEDEIKSELIYKNESLSIFCLALDKYMEYFSRKHSNLPLRTSV